MKKPLFQNVALIGLGMMGTSLGRDLLSKGMTANICGFDVSRRNLLSAKKIRAITDFGNIKHPKNFANCDLVIFSLPVKSIPGTMARISPWIRPECLVMDMGSTKKSILKSAQKYFPFGNFIGCHPMAGSEKSGPMASSANLFFGRTCFLVTSKKPSAALVRRAESMWRNLGAKIHFLNAAGHDAVVAAMSHLPHAVAFALARTLREMEPPFARRGMELKTAAGGGVRDTTRIAASSPEMWRDIFLDNAPQVIRGLKKFSGEPKILERAIRSGEVKKISSFIQSAAEWRRKLDQIL